MAILKQVNLIVAIAVVVLSEAALASPPQNQPKTSPLSSPVTATPIRKTQPSAAQLEVVAKIPQGPGNITITPDSRIIISLHQFYSPKDRVVEVKPNGTLVPFPNVEWTRGRNPDGTGLDSVLGIQADANGVVWMLDNGMRGQVTPQLVGWNTRTNQLEKVIPLPQQIGQPDSFLNDLAVDSTHDAVYISDPASASTAALIVVDLKTGEARRVLTGDRSVVPEQVDLVIDRTPVQSLKPDGSIERPRIGANPIALDARNEWLYFGPMHATRLYRIPTADLRNAQLSAEQLAQKVEDYAERPITDGISIDRENNIYIGDLSAHAIGVIRSDRTYQRLVSAAWLDWTDAFSFGTDGYLYSVVNQLNRSAALNAGVDATKPPFLIVRLKPLADGTVGR